MGVHLIGAFTLVGRLALRLCTQWMALRSLVRKFGGALGQLHSRPLQRSCSGGFGQSGWAAIPCCRLLVNELVFGNHPQRCAVVWILMYQPHVRIDALFAQLGRSRNVAVGVSASIAE